MVARPAVRSALCVPRFTLRVWLVAALAVLPLLAPEVWAGFRLALSDPIVAVLAPTEQPLSVRSPGGVWAIGLTVAWFGLAYNRRDVRLWEAALVVLGGAAALARFGNVWIYALAMLVPLARQVAHLEVRRWASALAVLVCGVATLATLVVSRPADLPTTASAAARASGARGVVFADWRWAAALQRDLGSEHQVLGTQLLVDDADAFWLDYIRVSQGHERWATALRAMHVDLVVLDAADQQAKGAALIRDSADWHVLSDADGALVAERINP